ncbi:MAG: hypothetical protein OHK0046_24680 [Anaerolineae bacterium]
MKKRLFVCTVMFGLAVLMVYNAAGQVVLETINQPVHLVELADETIREIAWHPGGEILAVATSENILLLSADLQAELARITHEGTSVTWSPDGQYLALGYETTVEVWAWDETAQSLSLMQTLNGFATQQAVTWSPDGQYLASLGSRNIEDLLVAGSLHIWNTDTWTLDTFTKDAYSLDQMERHADGLDWMLDAANVPMLITMGPQISVENDRLVGFSREFNVYIINPATGQVENTTLIPTGGIVLAWQPNTSLISIGGEIAVSLYDYVTGERVISYGYMANVETLAWSPDGRYLMADDILVDGYTETEFGFFYQPYPSPRVISTKWRPGHDELAIALENEITIQDPTLFSDYEAMVEDE